MCNTSTVFQPKMLVVSRNFFPAIGIKRKPTSGSTTCNDIIATKFWLQVSVCACVCACARACVRKTGCCKKYPLRFLQYLFSAIASKFGAKFYRHI